MWQRNYLFEVSLFAIIQWSSQYSVNTGTDILTVYCYVRVPFSIKPVLASVTVCMINSLEFRNPILNHWRRAFDSVKCITTDLTAYSYLILSVIDQAEAIKGRRQII